MPHIAILHHEQTETSKINYFVDFFANEWRKDGIQVSYLKGIRSFIEADILILHVDLTCIPDEYRSFAHRYPVVINARTIDISKKIFSQNVVQEHDNFAGPVIVKTNLNCFGAAEAKMIWAQSMLTRFKDKIFLKFFWHHRSQMTMTNYRLFNEKSLVPKPVWSHPFFIVEKFLPEIQSGKYCLRTWCFFGDQETISICTSNDPIIKSNNILDRKTLHRVPNKLRTIRKDLGFEFGKFDFAVVDGVPILFDINRTPSLNSMPKEALSHGLKRLSKGVLNLYADSK